MKTIKMFILLVLSILCIITYGKKVPLAKATSVARNFCKLHAKMTGINNDAAMEPVYLTSEEMTGKSLFYVFNFADHPGFIMVSATDAAIPVLCLSYESSWVDIDQIESPEARFWMNGYRQYLQTVVTVDTVPNSAVTQHWVKWQQPQAEKSITSSDYVAPLIKTIWNQGCGYNDYLPLCSNTNTCGRVLTGCVATAMAQVMK